ncbi:RAMP superfamily CRISPR-associated protein [Candidatus Chloroploca sp. Khr17]|uniref:RAMP superfamily CRISPR-associated protein n=1 Tax=Candidatus Chloroploca sp. Khr17 TaxID=2496869 RepID=UPI00101CDD1C|nr:RAMP superfamily CRISPR-associated protein [Candidatus Chloroploca sp. Khr17]
MPEVRIDLLITCTSALSVGAGGSSGSLADKSIVRDGRGRPLLPGSQVKGKVRHTTEALLHQLGEPTPAHFDDEAKTYIKTLFGSPRQRSPLRFFDLIGLPAGEDRDDPLRQIDPQALVEIRPAVSINRRRGTAEDERLFFQEVALDGLVYGATPAIRGTLADARLAALLWAALRLTTRWGGGSTRGFGWAEVVPTVWVEGTVREEEALEADLRALLGKGDGDAAQA